MSSYTQIIENIFKKYTHDYQHSCISQHEAGYIGLGIEQLKPKRFIEIGTSSGVSGGYISNLLHVNGGEIFVTLDLLTEFKVTKKAMIKINLDWIKR